MSARHTTKDRKAFATWKGSLRSGCGAITTESGILSKAQYSVRGGNASEGETDPDELIAASLGGCFAMALSNELGISGFHPLSIETTATAQLEDLEAGWTISRIQLDVHADVPDVSQANFMTAVLEARNCPIARLLNTNISLKASLN